MRKSGFTLLTTLALGVCALPSAAFAQDAAPAAPVAPAPAGAPAAAPATPATEPAAAPAAAPPPVAPTDAAPALAGAAPTPAEAAPPAPPAPPYPSTTITGFIEGGYHKILSAPHINTPVPMHAYDSGNGFQLHLAHLALKHQLNEHVFGVIEFDAGADAAYNHNPNGYPDKAGTGTLFDVQEAYGVYTDSGFTFTAGKFATYEGIEVIEGPADPTITRGFLYWLAEPVTHTGAKLHYASGPVDVGVGLVNGWDTNNGVFATGDNNDQKTVIWRAAVTPSPQFFAALSGSYGVEKATNKDPRLSVDLTGAFVPADNVTINFQGNVGSEKNSDVLTDPANPKAASWYGFGIQPVFKIDAATIGARFEYFQDKGLTRVGAAFPNTAVPAGTAAFTKVGLWNFTLTPGYTVAGAFTMRAEFRIDGASQPILGTGSEGKKTQETIALGAHYMF